MLPFERILCPTDFSEPSYRGLEAANQLARHFGAELLLVHVVTPQPLVTTPESAVPPQLANLQQELEAWARRTIEKVQTDRVGQDFASRSLVLRGDPADQIVETASRERADLIVIATHGHTGFRRFMFGSVAEKVVRRSDRPVLTVHAGPPREE